jgi:hypothetical protein
MRTAFRREIVDICESPWLHVRNVGACEGRGGVWRSDSGAIVTQGDMIHFYDRINSSWYQRSNLYETNENYSITDSL